ETIHDKNEYIQLALRTGLTDCTIFVHNTPVVVLLWLMQYHSEFHKGARYSFCEMISETPDIEAKWLVYKKQKGVASRMGETVQIKNKDTNLMETKKLTYEQSYWRWIPMNFGGKFTTFQVFDAAKIFEHNLNKFGLKDEFFQFYQAKCNFLSERFSTEVSVKVLHGISTLLAGGNLEGGLTAAQLKTTAFETLKFCVPLGDTGDGTPPWIFDKFDVEAARYILTPMAESKVYTKKPQFELKGELLKTFPDLTVPQEQFDTLTTLTAGSEPQLACFADDVWRLIEHSIRIVDAFGVTDKLLSTSQTALIRKVASLSLEFCFAATLTLNNKTYTSCGRVRPQLQRLIVDALLNAPPAGNSGVGGRDQAAAVIERIMSGTSLDDDEKESLNESSSRIAIFMDEPAMVDGLKGGTGLPLQLPQLMAYIWAAVKKHVDPEWINTAADTVVAAAEHSGEAPSVITSVFANFKKAVDASHMRGEYVLAVVASTCGPPALMAKPCGVCMKTALASMNIQTVAVALCDIDACQDSEDAWVRFWVDAIGKLAEESQVAALPTPIMTLADIYELADAPILKEGGMEVRVGACYLGRAQRALEKIVWDMVDPSCFAEAVAIDLSKKGGEPVALEITAKLNFVFAGSVQLWQSPPTKKSFKLATALGSDVRLHGDARSKTTSECPVPAWMVGTTPKEAEANVELTYTHKVVYLDALSLYPCARDVADSLRIDMTAPHLAPLAARVGATATPGAPFVLKRFAAATEGRQTGAKRSAAAADLSGAAAVCSGPSAKAIQERLGAIAAQKAGGSPPAPKPEAKAKSRGLAVGKHL
ncbi:unnamed protein product, partial [Prorocentrum cordatum]